MREIRLQKYGKISKETKSHALLPELLNIPVQVACSGLAYLVFAYHLAIRV